MNQPSDGLDPARLETATFELVRRGFDPAAVRALLRQVAGDVRDLQRRRDELAARVAEIDAVSAEQLEAHRVAEALGAEATQVLEAAHLAAAERAERAEREAEAVLAEARSAADAIRAEAQTQREEILDSARREAEEIREEGRRHGREMVAEAQTVRERMLKDLARKRQNGRAQVEQLRAGRDRLLESLAAAQDGLDASLADLVAAVPEARAAAERAGLRVTSEPEPSVEELEDEIVAARLIGHPMVDDIAAPGPVDEMFVTGEVEALTQLDVLEGPVAPATDDDQVVYDIEAEAEAEAEAGIADETEAVPVDGASQGDAGGEGEETGPADEPATPEGSDTGEPAAGPGDEVDDVFAKLRSTRGEAEAGPEQDADDADDAAPDADDVDDAAPEPDDAAQESEDDAPDPTEPDPSAADPGPAPDPTRGEARRVAADAAARAMKKVLVDEQGALLDGIRRDGAAALASVVDADGHAEPYTAAAEEALRELATALGGGARAVDEAIAAASVQIDQIALEPVRQRLREASDDLDDPDELSSLVRALYRESRTRRLVEAAHAAVVAVDGAVTLDGAATVRWHLEPGGPCGPDCADNELAGAVAAGTPFPTGDLHPPAHAACTCWLEVDPAE